MTTVAGIKAKFTESNDRHTYFELLKAWVLRTIYARYKQSILGILWAVVQPAARATIFTLIFTIFIPVDTGDIPYGVFAYTAFVPWTFFATALVDMVISLVTNINLMTKIYFPREILPLAALLARLLDFLIASVLLVFLMLYYGMPVFTVFWWYIPVILAIQIMFTLGLGLASAAANVFYRDTSHMIIFGVQIWMWITPIAYAATRVPERFRFYYFLNPMAGIVEAYRDVLLRYQEPTGYLWLALAIAFVTLVVGYWFFKRVEFQFADIV